MPFDSLQVTDWETIGRWFDAGVRSGDRYLMVYCDTFDWSDYCVYAKDDAEYWEKRNNQLYSMKNMQRLTEVYDLSMDKEAQLNEHRTMHGPTARHNFDKSPLSIDDTPFQHD